MKTKPKLVREFGFDAREPFALVAEAVIDQERVARERQAKREAALESARYQNDMFSIMDS